MKATDLRIGNLVTVNNPEFWPQLKDVPLSVYSITPNRSIKNDEWSYSIGIISLNERDNITMPLYAQMIDFIEPISITSDLLLKLGFVNRRCYYSAKELLITFDSAEKIFWVDYNYMGVCEITHVHQLQNIYNSLTGSELALADA